MKPADANCWWPRNADGSLKELPDCKAVPYPDDGGLKEQVRDIDATLSIDGVIQQMRVHRVEINMSAADAEKRRLQAQDPAHDHGPFGAPNPVWFDTSHKDEEPGVLPGRVSVEGTFTAYFENPELLEELRTTEKAWAEALDEFLYGPRWRRELMWAVHNLIAHPISEITHWLGYLHPKIRDAGLWLHDNTVPRHAPNTGRG